MCVLIKKVSEGINTHIRARRASRLADEWGAAAEPRRGSGASPRGRPPERQKGASMASRPYCSHWRSIRWSPPRRVARRGSSRTVFREGFVGCGPGHTAVSHHLVEHELRASCSQPDGTTQGIEGRPRGPRGSGSPEPYGCEPPRASSG